MFLRNVSILSAKGVSRSQLADALDLVARGRIKPRSSDVYPLEDAAEAHRLVEAGLSTGRLVLRPTDVAKREGFADVAPMTKDEPAKR